MDTINETTQQTTGFIQHILNFDTSTKNELLNVSQYSLLCIIPIVLMNKGMSRLFPEADESKGTLELSVEVAGQIVSLFLSMFFINRLVTYIQPYSGEKYPPVHLVNVSLAFLVIVLSFQTQLAEKVEILVDRITELWTGQPTKQSATDTSKVRVTQPLTNSIPLPTHQDSRADYLGTHNQMASNPSSTQPVHLSNAMYQQSVDIPQQTQPQAPNQPQQQTPNFDNMFQEPQAANEGFGAFASF